MKNKLPVDGFIRINCAIALLGMPLVHIAEAHLYMETLISEFETMSSLFELLSVFGPGIFMICMGLGAAGKISPQRLRKTGIQFLIINEGLNIIRYGIPIFLGALGGAHEFYEIPVVTIQPDIYSFVGMFYIGYSYLKELKLSIEKILIVGIFGVIAGCLISTFVYLPINILTTLIAYVIPVNEMAYFPLISWFIYPCIGIYIKERVLAEDLRRSNKFFAIVCASSLAVFMATYLYIRHNSMSVIGIISEFVLQRYYGPVEIILVMVIVLLVISLTYFAYHLIPANRIEKLLLSLYNMIFPYYVIHWLVVSAFTYYMEAAYYAIFGERWMIEIWVLLIEYLCVVMMTLYLTFKKGFTFSKWLLKVSDYTRWKKKS